MNPSTQTEESFGKSWRERMSISKIKHSHPIIISTLLLLPFLCLSLNFDFYFFVQQWPDTYCNTVNVTCCNPKAGKPAPGFTIHGLWPNNNDGSYPENCDPSNVFDRTKIADLLSSMQQYWPSFNCPSSDGAAFWKHEWEKHGTCSESLLDQRGYFEATLKLRERLNLLQILDDAGIKANDEFYSLNSIIKALKGGVGFTPLIECSKNSGGNSLLFQVYFCVDIYGSELINCPDFPNRNCDSKVIFPSYKNVLVSVD